jgi:hypothetical protein
MKKIIGIFACTLMLIPALSTTAVADPGPELKVEAFGGSILTGISRAGGVICNGGDGTINDIQITLTIAGGFDDSIYETYQDTPPDELDKDDVIVFLTSGAQGFGPVTITFTATSSNAGEETSTIKGFQLGPITIGQSYFTSFVRASY